MTWALLALVAVLVPAVVYQTYRLGKSDDTAQLNAKMYRDALTIASERHEKIMALTAESVSQREQLASATAKYVRSEIRANRAEQRLGERIADEIVSAPSVDAAIAEFNRRLLESDKALREDSSPGDRPEDAVQPAASSER